MKSSPRKTIALCALFIAAIVPQISKADTVLFLGDSIERYGERFTCVSAPNSYPEPAPAPAPVPEPIYVPAPEHHEHWVCDCMGGKLFQVFGTVRVHADNADAAAGIALNECKQKFNPKAHTSPLGCVGN